VASEIGDLGMDAYVPSQGFESMPPDGWRGSSLKSRACATAVRVSATMIAGETTTPADDLLSLPMLQPDKVTDPLHACQISKRGNSLRVKAEG
jgi:hypothetical protein